MLNALCNVQGFSSAEEARQFDSEWQSRAQGSLLPGFGDASRRGSRQEQRRIQSGPGYESHPAINNGPDVLNAQADQRYRNSYYDRRFRQI
jgi:hypothetical protein